jgi:hypothetical protein
MLYNIFLSHSADDRRWVEWLRQHAAERLGITAYLFEHDPQPGTPVSAKIQAQIRGSDAVVVFLTANSQFSAYVQQEIGFAIASGKLILPIVQPGIDQKCLAMLGGLEHIPFDFGNPQTGLNNFLVSLERMVGEKALKEFAEQQRQQAEQQRQQAAVALLAFGTLLVVAIGASKG